MPLVLAASVVLVVATVLVLYETLRPTSAWRAALPVPPRARIAVVVLAAFAGRTVAVRTSAGADGLPVLRLGLRAFSGVPIETFALDGLILIGWSASFTDLAMDRYRPLHGGARREAAPARRERAGLRWIKAAPPAAGQGRPPGRTAGRRRS